MPVYLGRFRELRGFPTAGKILVREKVVVLPMNLAVARWASRAGDRVTDVTSLGQQAMGYRRLPTARRRRKNDRERAHSRFSTCSRIRSSSSLIAITSSWIWASLALLPTVFASRFISWRINPRRLPTG